MNNGREAGSENTLSFEVFSLTLLFGCDYNGQYFSKSQVTWEDVWGLVRSSAAGHRRLSDLCSCEVAEPPSHPGVGVTVKVPADPF